MASSNKRSMKKPTMACAEGAPVAPVAEGEAPAAAPDKVSRPLISKASIRRLAHDVGARVGKEALDGAMTGLTKFMEEMLGHASSAMLFSRKKSISLKHMHFAANVNGGSPASLLGLSSEHLQRLSKSNPQAPSALRKDVLWRAEISEASFRKVMKGILKAKAETNGTPLRVTCQARRLLQLLSEYHVMKTFDRKGTLLGKEQEDPPALRSFMRIFSCDQASAELLLETTKDLERRMQALLAIGPMKTVDERLLRTALGSAHAWALTWVPPESFVSVGARRAMDRILRSSVLDKRVTARASEIFAACLQRIALEAQRLPVPEGSHLTESAGRPRAEKPVKKTALKPSRTSPLAKRSARKPKQTSAAPAYLQEASEVKQ